MIILDTNVVSEPLRPKPNAEVIAWLDRQLAESLYLTAISLSELLLGLRLMPEGKRKQGVQTAMNRINDELFSGRILGFGQEAAKMYAKIVAEARGAGNAIAIADGQIAAIAKVHNFTVATRDTNPFTVVGINVINPWINKAKTTPTADC